MNRWVLLAGLGWSLSVAAAQEIGVVTEAHGSLELLRNDTVYAAAAGTPLQADDLLETGGSAEGQLEMVDGSVLELGPESRLYLTEYQTDASGSVGRATIGVLAGWLRFLTGRLSRDVDYQYVTSTATIGIRGTSGVIRVTEQETELLLNDGEVEVAELDERGVSGALTRVRAGEYLSRRKGQRARHAREARRKFLARMPQRYKRQTVRKLLRLEGRRVPPRPLRRVPRDQFEKILRRNPKLHQRLEERFKRNMNAPHSRRDTRRWTKPRTAPQGSDNTQNKQRRKGAGSRAKGRSNKKR